jgi:hypothetical protein
MTLDGNVMSQIRLFRLHHITIFSSAASRDQRLRWTSKWFVTLIGPPGLPFEPPWSGLEANELHRKTPG